MQGDLCLTPCSAALSHYVRWGNECNSKPGALLFLALGVCLYKLHLAIAIFISCVRPTRGNNGVKDAHAASLRLIKGDVVDKTFSIFSAFDELIITPLVSALDKPDTEINACGAEACVQKYTETSCL